jgi:hypothetical protein
MRIIASRTTRSSLSSRRLGILGLTLLALVCAARPAFAGPPLLCHAFDIGTAASLPWSGVSSWYDGQPGYDLQKLTDNTEALLTPSTPVIVRMETLRRAAIYASRDPLVAKRLYLTISDRVRTTGAGGAPNALALFDAGYLTETFKEIGRLGAHGFREVNMNAEAMSSLVKGVDGYAMVQKSLALRADDPAIEFASALIAASTMDRKDRYAQHAEKARAGAKQDALLAKNLKQISD